MPGVRVELHGQRTRTDRRSGERGDCLQRARRWTVIVFSCFVGTAFFIANIITVTIDARIKMREPTLAELERCGRADWWLRQVAIMVFLTIAAAPLGQYGLWRGVLSIGMACIVWWALNNVVGIIRYSIARRN